MRRIANVPSMSGSAYAISFFFVTFALGIAALAIVGHVVSGVQYLENFTRFHIYLNPTTLYYPTASQAVSLAKEQADQGKIVIVIGGSSIMWGAAHSDAELWTRTLQADLGDQYGVVNLALPSGSPQEHGAVALQYLLMHGYKAVYLSDIGSNFGKPDGLFYPYVYWDAYYKGYLYPNPDAMPVIELMSTNPIVSRAIAPELDELKARSVIDSVLYYTDFWNFVGYKLFFTVWNPLVSSPTRPFYTARDQYINTQGTYPEAQRYASPPFDRAMEITRGYVAPTCPTGETGPNSKGGAALFWSEWDSTARVAFPAAIRRNIMLVRVLHARPYRDALTDDERRCYAQTFVDADARLSAHGYGAVTLGADWTEADYIDVVHTSAGGGVKTADELAPRIRELARELGYTQ